MPLPKALDIAAEPLCDGWQRLLRTSASQLKRSACDVSWHFFSLPQQATTTCTALTAEVALTKALERALAKLDAKWNAAEIQAIDTRRIGPAWCCTVCVRAAHLQQSPLLPITRTVAMMAPCCSSYFIERPDGGVSVAKGVHARTQIPAYIAGSALQSQRHMAQSA